MVAQETSLKLPSASSRSLRDRLRTASREVALREPFLANQASWSPQTCSSARLLVGVWLMFPSCSCDLIKDRVFRLSCFWTKPVLLTSLTTQNLGKWKEKCLGQLYTVLRIWISHASDRSYYFWCVLLTCNVKEVLLNTS